MTGNLRRDFLRFRIERTDEPLIARAGIVGPYEIAKAMKLPEVIDRELPPPSRGHSYKPSPFVLPLVLMLHGGGKKLEDLREIKGEVHLRELLEMKDGPASYTVGDWLRRRGRDSRGLGGLGKVKQHGVAEVLKRDSRTGTTLLETEKEVAQWTYQKEKGYQPPLGFLFKLGLAPGDEFREGNVPQLQKQEPQVTKLILEVLGDGVIEVGYSGRVSRRDLLPTALMGGNNEMPHNFGGLKASVTMLLNRALGA